MKRKVTLLFLAILALGILVYGKDSYENLNNWLNTSFCDRPIKYKIARIDKEFDINKQELSNVIKESANVWGSVWGKSIFVEDQEGDLTINLVYDGRQKIVDQINNLGGNVDENKTIIEEKNRQFTIQQQEIQREMAKLNSDIKYWNSKGGAPEKEYNKLIERQKALEIKINEYNFSVEKLNNEVEKVNQTVEKLNSNVEDLNSTLEDKPEMGLYTSGINQIDIYFYSNQNELKHVIAHELGHALGLDHIDIKDAIMNPTTSENTTATKEDTEALKNFCSTKKRVDIMRYDFTNMLFKLETQLDSLNK